MARVLIGCEHSGRVRDAFRFLGNDAWSCDLLPSDGDNTFHIQGNVLDVLNDDWDLAIFHPDCTYLTIAAEWAYKDTIKGKRMKEGTLIGAARREAREQAVAFFMLLAQAPIPRIAIENPIGVMSKRFRPPDQFIQPYEYGDNACKRTCLWLKGLPNLRPTGLYAPRLVLSPDDRSYVMRWGNQTDSGQNKEPPSKDRWKIRSMTPQGWANAMAFQWNFNQKDS